MTELSSALDGLTRHNASKIVSVVLGIQDEDLKTLSASLLCRAVEARGLLDLVDLKPFEAAEYPLDALAIWKCVSRQYIEALGSVVRVITAVESKIPRPPEFEGEDRFLDAVFSLVDEPIQGAWTPPENERSLAIDDLLIRLADGSAQCPERSLGPALCLRQISWQIAVFLKDEIGSFKDRIAMRSVVADRWNLVGELHETRHRLRKGLAAFLIGICSGFAPVRREDIVPDYQTELHCSLSLRRHVGRWDRRMRVRAQAVMQQKQEDWRVYAEDTYWDLETTIFGPMFALMRPRDKRRLIELRNHTKTVLSDVLAPFQALGNIIFETAAFLEELGAISEREVLITHDREALSIARLGLEAVLRAGDQGGQSVLDSALDALASLEGRDIELDQILSNRGNSDTSMSPRELLRLVDDILSSLQR